MRFFADLYSAWKTQRAINRRAREMLLDAAQRVDTSRYTTEHHCVHCDRVLSDHQRMYSNGRCPLCGVKSDGAGTIVETEEHCVKK